MESLRKGRKVKNELSNRKMQGRRKEKSVIMMKLSKDIVGRKGYLANIPNIPPEIAINIDIKAIEHAVTMLEHELNAHIKEAVEVLDMRVASFKTCFKDDERAFEYAMKLFYEHQFKVKGRHFEKRFSLVDNRRVKYPIDLINRIWAKNTSMTIEQVLKMAGVNVSRQAFNQWLRSRKKHIVPQVMDLPPLHILNRDEGAFLE